MNLLEAMADDNLFGRHFARSTWDPWRAFIAALFGLPLPDGTLDLYRQCTARDDPPDGPAREAWLVIGRRGGKSRILALIATYLATFRDWSPYLAAGERGHVLIVASDRRQARVILGYLRAFVAETPLLAPLMANETQESLELTNGITIEVATCSFRTIRGRTVIAALLDEVAFWRDESSANPDTEVVAALAPAMASIPGSLLLAASSPYARRGVLYRRYKRYHGVPGPVLSWQAPTLVMNPGLPAHVVEQAYEDDAASAAAEYGAEFRSDIEGFVSIEVVEGCVDPSIRERAPLRSYVYSAFVDPSGGSQDSMTLAISHQEGAIAVLDAIRERKPPFSPEDVVQEFAALLKSYGIVRVQGDRYAGEWPREVFKNHGIAYEASARPKSDLYRDLLPKLNSGGVALLDDPRLVAQLVGLERRTSRGGRDSIDHAPGAHDDVANAVAGALVGSGQIKLTMLDVLGDEPDTSWRTVLK